VTVTASIADASRLVSPPSTVVHVCTPPASRVPVLTELAERGFVKLVVEKPLATDHTELDGIIGLCRRHDLDLVVVSHWLHADLTHRLRQLVGERTLGRLLSVTVAQDKPRFLRSLTTEGHPTAFDVEVPHALGVVLDLAGPARLLDARWTDMRCGDTVRPRMGGARLTLAHGSGVRSEITSDLTAPVQRRSITLTFRHGRAIGHYPLSENDDHAQLMIHGAGHRRQAVHAHHVFRDDALTTFMRRTYREFTEGRRADPTPHHEVVRLLCAAKDHCRAEDPCRTRDRTRTENAHAR
jgi:predicted dehydrogenase